MYSGSLAYADKALGDFLATIAEYLDLNRSVIVVTSDHGEAFFEHERPRVGHKGKVWEEQIRIPFIMWGRNVPSGRQLTEAASLVDVVPTLLGIVDPSMKKAGDFQGLDLLDGEDGRTRGSRLIASEHLSIGWQAFIKGEWKLMYSSKVERHWLYNLHKDPLEKLDLVKERKDVLQQLLDERAAWVTGPRCGQSPLAM
jgi:uncharacterized sulfatase